MILSLFWSFKRKLKGKKKSMSDLIENVVRDDETRDGSTAEVPISHEGLSLYSGFPGVVIDKFAAEQLKDCREALHGWCDEEKSSYLYQLVRRERPEIAVEIGIYGGRSIVPVALALRDNQRGIVYGIEAWSPIVATSFKTGEANDQWWQKVDFSAVKKSFFQYIIDRDLLTQIAVLQTTSTIAHHAFTTIDFLHIDGNHSVFGAAQDVANYVPKVKSGGIIVFDDANWTTTQSALAMLDEVATKLGGIFVPDGALQTAVYRKN